MSCYLLASHRGVGVTICCPGPIATGNDGKPRSVYGASGRVDHAETSAGGKKRLDPAAAAAWIGSAAYHGLDEAWISRQPVLFLSAISRSRAKAETQDLLC